MNEITPETVAAAACERVGGWMESLQSALSVNAEGNVLSLSVTRWEDDEQGTEIVRHFRAVVVPGERLPIVLPRPDVADCGEFEGEPYDADDATGWQVCAASVNARPRPYEDPDAVSILFRGSGHISLGEARRFAAALVAKVDAIEAAQAEQSGGAQ